ncbi:MAG: transcriptional regulator [Rhodocyclales bacterium]|nr:transcriptional regulator [Rhodocyclales bacterium]
MRVLLLSRSAPPESCARLLAHGAMHEMDAATLAFSPLETERLLALVGVAQAAALRDAVFKFTHGWAAGVTLAASWFKRRPDAVARVDEISDLVASYLATEVFSAFSEAERDTLLSVCWLPYFRTRWAATLAGSAQAAEILTRLAGQGALIYQYPGQQYTLHPLFQRFLRDWAESRVAAERRRQWIECGIRLLEDDGSLDDAVELALAQGSMAQAAAMIARCAEGLLASARHQTVARWIRLLPEELRGPWFHYWLGMATYVSDTADARESLLKAYEAFSATGDNRYRFIALTMIIISYSFDGMAKKPLKEMLAHFVDAEEEYARLADPELRAHLALGIYSGLGTTDPGHPDLDLWEQRCLGVLSEPVGHGMKVRVCSWAAIHNFFAGRYRRISALRALQDSLVDLGAVASYQRYLVHFMNQFDELVRGDHAALARSYAACRQSSDDTGFRNMDGHYGLQYADSLMLQGDADGARAVLAKVASIMPPGYFNLAGHFYVVQSSLAARSGDVAAAREFAQRVTEAGRSFGSVPYEIWGRIGACVAAALAGASELAEQVAQLRRRGEEVRYPAARIHADLLDAWRLLQAGDAAAALAPLRDALLRLDAESEGFLWGAPPQVLQPLCALALREDVAPQAARNVIRAFRLTPPADAPPRWPWPLAVRCFGGFELRIDGAPLPSRGKSKHRQLDLVKFLAAHAPAGVPMARAAESLWPDSEGDAARHALETTLSRLRGTFGREVFRLEHGMLSFNGEVCGLDTAGLEELMTRLEADLAAGRADAAAAAENLLGLYRGDLLSGEDAAWVMPRREYWRGRFARVFGAAARVLVETGRFAEAVGLFERALDADPHGEALILSFMTLCCDAGHPAEGLAAYRRYRRNVRTSYGAAAPEIESLAKRMQAGAVAAGNGTARRRSLLPDR